MIGSQQDFVTTNHVYAARTARAKRIGLIIVAVFVILTAGIWAATKNRSAAHPYLTLAGHSKEVDCLAFSPNGRTLASGSIDTTIKLWNVQAGWATPRTLAGRGGWVICVAFSPDGTLLATGHQDNTVKLWDVETGELKHTFQGHEDRVMTVAFSPDGKTLASGSWDTTIKLWNVETGELLHTLNEHSDAVFSVAFSPDGKLLASGQRVPQNLSDITAALWDVQTGKLKHSLQGTTGTQTVSFSSDGKRLAGNDSSNLVIWDVETGASLHRWNTHASTVRFSPDDATLICAHQNEITFQNAMTGEVQNTLHDENIGSTIALSSDGSLLATSSSTASSVWAIQGTPHRSWTGGKLGQ